MTPHIPNGHPENPAQHRDGPDQSVRALVDRDVREQPLDKVAHQSTKRTAGQNTGHEQARRHGNTVRNDSKPKVQASVQQQRLPRKVGFVVEERLDTVVASRKDEAGRHDADDDKTHIRIKKATDG